MIHSINPATGELLGSVPVSSETEIQARVAQARLAQPGWAAIALADRVQAVRCLLDCFVREKTALAALITTEMGKPLRESAAELEDGFECIQWYAQHAAVELADVVNHDEQHEFHQAIYRPRGVTAAITPWNFPFLNAVWAVIPNLIAGNTVVFKHSEKTPLFCRQFEAAAARARLPTGVFNVVYGGAAEGALLVHQDIDQVCFTGSTRSGLAVHRAALEQAERRNRIIPVHSELGGSAAGIVFPDVDLATTVRHIYKARFDNCGQVCDGLKRLIVHTDILDGLVAALLALLGQKTVGDPTRLTTHVGPMADAAQLRLLKEQVQDAREKGAQVLIAGTIQGDERGFYHPLLLLLGVTPEMRVWSEEVFGPVLPIVAFSDTAEAVALANDSAYGLGGYVYSADIAVINRVRVALNTGMVGVNGAYYVRPFLPFTSGGYGLSGTGSNNGPDVFRRLCHMQLTSYRRMDQLPQAATASSAVATNGRKVTHAVSKLSSVGVWREHPGGTVEIAEYPLPLGMPGRWPQGHFKVSLFAFAFGTPEEDAYFVVRTDLASARSDAPPLVRLQSLCPHGHLLYSAHCDCHQQRDLALEQIAASNTGGILIFGVGERQIGRGLGNVMIAALYSYGHKTGRDVVTASFTDLGFRRDTRDFVPMLEVLRLMGVRQIRLLTNNPEKAAAIAQSSAIQVVETIGLTGRSTPESLKERLLLSDAGHNYDLAELERLRSKYVDVFGTDPLDNW